MKESQKLPGGIQEGLLTEIPAVIPCRTLGEVSGGILEEILEKTRRKFLEDTRKEFPEESRNDFLDIYQTS